MNMRLIIALLASLAFVQPAVVLADAGQQIQANASAAPVTGQSVQSCLKPGDSKLNMAQVGQVQCCKEHKGVCGCRAGKIVCCDGSASTEPGCTCHGEDGFIQ